MKKFFTLLLMFVVIGVYAQNTLSVTYEGNVLNPTDTVYPVITYTPNQSSSDFFEFYLYITNTTDETVTYDVWRSGMDMIDGALVTMCIGSSCYPPQTEQSAPVNIEGHATDTFHISYYPYLGVGTSHISFQFMPYPATKTADYSEITFAITTRTSTAIRNDVTVSEFRAYPNPASGIVNIAYSYKGEASNVDLVVKNLMGATITRQAIPANGNVVKLNISDFASGIYFYSIEADGRALSTKKLLVK